MGCVGWIIDEFSKILMTINITDSSSGYRCRRGIFQAAPVEIVGLYELLPYLASTKNVVISNGLNPWRLLDFRF